MIEFFGWKERKMKWWDTHISNISIWAIALRKVYFAKKMNKQAGISLLPSTPPRMNGPQTM